MAACITYSCSAADINAAIGDKITMNGTALVTDSVYLFVTGPGLPQNGVNPSSMQVAAITGMPGTFSVIDVNNDHWTYTWNTARQGFALKEGLYTMYAVKQPVNKADLGSKTYGSTTIALTYGGGPFLTTGTVLVNSTPVQAEVYLGNQLMGLTPQVLDVPVGTYSVQLVSDGHKPFSRTVSVAAGSTTEINGTMVPLEVPSTATMPSTGQSTPVETSVPLNTPNSPAPTTSPIPLVSLAFAIGIALVIFSKQLKRA
jgi:hypothetical protein